MEILHFTLPNTCGLISCPGALFYVEGSPESKIYPPQSYTSFEQFVTKDEAAARAKELDPSYDVNNIYGPLVLTPVNVSTSPVSAYEGANVTLHCEYSCGDNEVVYEWLNPGGLPIPGATGPELTIGNITPIYDGTYTCNVSASNAKGQTGSASGSFKVTVFPPFGGSVGE
jgi:hypothetical protein